MHSVTFYYFTSFVIYLPMYNMSKIEKKFHFASKMEEIIGEKYGADEKLR